MSVMAAKALMKSLLLFTRVFKAASPVTTLLAGTLSTRFAAVAPLAAASLAISVTSLN